MLSEKIRHLRMTFSNDILFLIHDIYREYQQFHINNHSENNSFGIVP